MKSISSNTLFRWLKRIGIGVLVVALFAGGVFFAANFGDETLSPEAIALLKMRPRTVADHENAFLALVGIGAENGVTPIAAARSWIDHVAAEDVAAQKEWRVGKFRPAPKANLAVWTTLRCEMAKEACVPKWQAKRNEVEAALRQLEQQRSFYSAALLLPKFEESSAASVNAPWPDYGSWSRLGEMHLAQAVLLSLDGQSEVALKLIAQKMALDRLVLRQAETLVAKSVAIRQLHATVHVVNELGKHLPEFSKTHQTTLAQLLRPLSDEEADMGMALTAERAFVLRVLEQHKTNPKALFATLGESAGAGSLGNIIHAWGFRVNQTLNAETRYTLPFVTAATGGARGYAQRRTQADEQLSAFAQTGEPAWHWIRNPTGKMLAQFATPNYTEYTARGYDLDGFIRISALAARARAEGVAGTGMAAWLAAQAEPLRNPYDGSAMRWDVGKNAIVFEGKSKSTALPTPQTLFAAPL